MTAIRYVVHSCARQSFEMPVQVGDRTMVATMQGLVVELVSDDKSMTHTLRLQPEDLIAAEELYQEGAVIEGVFSLVEDN